MPSPPIVEDEVLSLLKRAEAAHERKLRELRDLCELNKSLTSELFDVRKRVLQCSGLPLDDSSAPLVWGRIAKEPPEAKNTSDVSDPLRFGSGSTFPEVGKLDSGLMNRDERVFGLWLRLSERLLLHAGFLQGFGDSFGKGVWKRWLLLSYHLLRFCMDGRPVASIRGKDMQFEILSVWSWRTRKKICLSGEVSAPTNIGAIHSNSVLDNTNPILRKLVIHPQSSKLLLWVLIGGIVVLYDLYMIPLDLCELATAPMSISLSISIFWVMDFFVCCLTGIETHECYIDMRLGTTLRAYATSWLIPDLLVISIDMFLLGMDRGVLGTLRANKVVRLIRLIRLCRLRKVGEAWRSFLNTVYAAYVVMLGKVFKYIVIMFTCNHYIACLWYGLALWNRDRNVPNWLEAECCMVEGSTASYVYSLHWALTQVSPATQNISAQNPHERAFSLFVALFALVSFSSFISQLTNALNQLLRAKKDRDKQEQLLREFFRLRGISSNLGSRIISFFNKRYEATQIRRTEKGISFMSEVPESMLLLLHEEMYLNVLMGNLFFAAHYDVHTHSNALKICHTAMHELSVYPCQDVFISGSDNNFVYAITQGNLLYTHKKIETKVGPGDWLSEAGLWMKWEHVGTLSASPVTRCDLATVHLHTLHSIFASGAGSLYEPFRCLAVFSVEQAESAASKGILPTDLPLDDTCKELICRRATAFMKLKGPFKEVALRNRFSNSSTLAPQDQRYRSRASHRLTSGMKRLMPSMRTSHRVTF